MTPRNQISWVDAEASVDDIRVQLLDTPHSLFPVARGELDEIVGVVRAKELLIALDHELDVATFAARNACDDRSRNLGSLSIFWPYSVALKAVS